MQTQALEVKKANKLASTKLGGKLVNEYRALGADPSRLDEWWQREVGWSPDNRSVLRKARIRFDELLQRAKESGWETGH